MLLFSGSPLLGERVRVLLFEKMQKYEVVAIEVKIYEERMRTDAEMTKVRSVLGISLRVLLQSTL